jgi:hypothetical protein
VAMVETGSGAVGRGGLAVEAAMKRQRSGRCCRRSAENRGGRYRESQSRTLQGPSQMASMPNRVPFLNARVTT